MRSHQTVSIVCIASFVVVGGAHAQLPLARLTVLDPCGGKIGSTFEVSVNGTDLEGLRGLVFGRPGVTATLIKDNKFKVTIAADAAPGLIDVRATGDYGTSNPRAFYVDRFDEVKEVEPNNLRSAAQPVAINSVVNGVIAARADVDYFKIKAAPGQRIVIESFAERIDSRLDPVLAAYDPSGRLVSRCQHYVHNDALLDFVPTQAGEYTIQLHDLVYNGSGESFYRLAIHTQPSVDHVFPPVVARNAAGTVTVYGRNLPGGQSQPGPQSTGRPLEALSATITPPAEPTRLVGLSSDMYLASNQVGIDGFTHRFALGGGTQPVLVGLCNQPVVLEKEPNDSEAAAQTVSVPVEYVGRCDKPLDADWIRFAGKKDQTLRIEGIAERAGNQMDISIVLRRVLPDTPNQPKGTINAQDIGEYDDYGNNVGRLKFDTGTHDPLVDFKVPADGDYLIQVRDRFGENRGGARFVYRLRIAPIEADFRLVVVPSDENNPSPIVVRQGGTVHAHVFLLRLGGFAGEVKVEASGLPAGVTAPAVMIGPAVNEAPIVFKAEPNAAAFDGAVTITGSATVDGKALSHVARSGVVTWPQGPNQAKPARVAQSVCLSVRESAPYLLAATPSLTTFGQGSQVTIQLKLERRWADFVGKMTGIGAQNLPPNVNSPQVEIGEKQADGLLHILFPNNVPTGTYSFIVAGTAPVPFTKSKDPKAQKQPVNVIDPSLPITVTILARPVELGVNPNPPQVKIGQTAQVKVSVNRVNAYKGPVTLKLTAPRGLTGLTAADVAVPADKNEGVLVIACAGNVPAGDKTFCTVRGVCSVNNQAITVDAPVTVKVVQ